MARRQMGTTIFALLLGFGLATAPALTQTATPAEPSTTPSPPMQPGVGPKTTDPSQIDKGQNMILPSAGQSGESAAPTMVFDCEKKPQDCTAPVTPADKTSKPTLSAPPATSASGK